MTPRALVVLPLLSACLATPVEGTDVGSDTSGTETTMALTPTTTTNTPTPATSLTTGADTEPGSTTGDTDQVSTSTSLGESSSDTTAGEQGETTSPPPDCDLTLDVAFVVSRAPGMNPHQEKLRTAVAAFFEPLAAQADLDLHILVTDMDRSFGAEECEDTLCPQNNSCEPLEPDYPCDHVPTECDAKYGASVSYPVGVGAANEDCGFAPFLSEVDASALECALTLGEGTDSIDFGPTVQGLVGATNEPCNGGFLREDSLFVIVLVTDGDDTTFTNPPQWIADATADRSPDTFLVGAFMGDAPKVSEFVDAFPFSVEASIDQPDFSSALEMLAVVALDSFCG